MIYAALADAVVVLHGAFILFVVLGGGLVFWRRGLAWLHLPCVAWGILGSLYAWICPLTDLENHWRRAAGARGYEGGYIEHYLLPLIYPPGMTRGMQLALGLGLMAFNLVVYALVWRYWRGRENRALRAGRKG